MKKSPLISLALLAIAMAGYNPLIVESGDEILAQLTEGNHNHYVFLFYMPADQTSHLGYKNEKMLEEVRDEFLDKNEVESVYFTTINIAEEGYENLIEATKLDVSVLSETPVVILMEHGNGYIIRGPRTAQAIGEYIAEL